MQSWVINICLLFCCCHTVLSHICVQSCFILFVLITYFQYFVLYCGFCFGCLIVDLYNLCERFCFECLIVADIYIRTARGLNEGRFLKRHIRHVHYNPSHKRKPNFSLMTMLQFIHGVSEINGSQQRLRISLPLHDAVLKDLFHDSRYGTCKGTFLKN